MAKKARRLIEEACRGIRPECSPIFDILANDRVIEHFAGRLLIGTSTELDVGVPLENYLAFHAEVMRG